MNARNTRALSIVVKEDLVRRFFLLLQGGFSLRIRVGCSVRAFLSGPCGFSDEYIEKRIQTIFLDGKPVDDIDGALLHDGSRLSLSGAMPGLVGATMRRGSPYAAFRKTISHVESCGDTARADGVIHLKLFNVIMQEQGASFLGRGIFIPSQEVYALLSREEREFWAGCAGIQLDRVTCDGPGLLKELSEFDGDIFLSVGI